MKQPDAEASTNVGSFELVNGLQVLNIKTSSMHMPDMDNALPSSVRWSWLQ